MARVDEGEQLRDAGIDAPVMLLSEPAPRVADRVVAHRLTPVVYTESGIDAVAKAVADAGRAEPLDVHLKVDTGMHRVGCTPEEAVTLVEQIAAHDELTLGGVCTHLAVADEPGNPYTAEQLGRFDAVLDALEARGLRPPLVHAANSAAAPDRPAGALRPRAGRHLRLRHAPRAVLADLAGVALRRRSRCGARHVREDAAGRRPPVVRAAVRARAVGRGSRPCPRGTPTACPATSDSPAAKC